MKKIRVALCDDADYVTECIKMKLDDPEFEVTGVSNTSAGCLEMLRRAGADVLLLDIQIEHEYSGIDLIPKIKLLFPDLKIIILTGYDDDRYVFSAFAAGADNYIFKTFNFDIKQTIHDTFYNQFSLRPEIAKKLVTKTREVSDRQESMLYIVSMLTKLSTAEFEVLLEIYNGLKYKEIASQRFVSEATIKTHAQRILKKTESSSMKDLIKLLKKLRVLELFFSND